MKASYDTHPFWGGHSPLSSLAGGSLLILASNRFSFALVCAGSLLWVYCLTALVVFTARPILPQKGRQGLFVFLSALIGSLYLLLLWFMSPLLVLNTFFFLILSPVCFIASGLLERIWPGDLARSVPADREEVTDRGSPPGYRKGAQRGIPDTRISGGSFAVHSPGIEEVLARSFSEAATLGILILALSLIREPIGFAVFSFPGGVQGIVTLFSAEEEGFFPVHIVAASAGALMLLGYGIALFKQLRGQYSRGGADPSVRGSSPGTSTDLRSSEDSPLEEEQ
jgi:hypothetical protein